MAVGTSRVSLTRPEPWLCIEISRAILVFMRKVNFETFVLLKGAATIIMADHAQGLGRAPWKRGQ